MRRWNWKYSPAVALGFAALTLMFPGAGDLARRFLTSLLSPLQSTSRSIGMSLADKAEALDGASVPVHDYDRVSHENLALKAEVAALQEELAQSRDLVRRLSGLREVFPDSGFVLIPAPVVSRDAIPSRESLLLKKPTDAPWDKLTKGQWAVARLFATLPEGLSGGALDEAPVFYDKAVVGRLEMVSGGWCRVRLLTDPDFQSKAEIIDAAGSTVCECLLVGRGPGPMRARYVETGKVKLSREAEYWVRVPGSGEQGGTRRARAEALPHRRGAVGGHRQAGHGVDRRRAAAPQVRFGGTDIPVCPIEESETN